MTTATETKERPILFSGAMIRAILNEDSPKTQTRRIVKQQPQTFSYGGKYAPTFQWNDAYGTTRVHGVSRGPADMIPFCPYGRPGDRLWVRETWAKNYAGDRTRYWYRADGEPSQRIRDRDSIGKWRPSIHMPRAASRITLEITAVRVERLQDISEADAMSEGIKRYLPPYPFPEGWPRDANEKYTSAYGVEYAADRSGFATSARSAFERLWDGINGASAPWASNPWVFVIEFKRIHL